MHNADAAAAVTWWQHDNPLSDLDQCKVDDLPAGLHVIEFARAATPSSSLLDKVRLCPSTTFSAKVAVHYVQLLFSTTRLLPFYNHFFKHSIFFKVYTVDQAGVSVLPRQVCTVLRLNLNILLSTKYSIFFLFGEVTIFVLLPRRRHA